MTDPGLVVNSGTLSGVYHRIGEVQRRVSTLESGRGYLGAINGGTFQPGTIPGSALVVGSITSELIQVGAIDAGHIQADAITAIHIQANAVNANHIQADSINTTHIVAGAVTAGQIAANTITANQIAANAITADELAADSVTAAKILANTITANEIAANAITTSELAADSVTATHITANAVTASELSANSVYTDALQAGAVTSQKITVTTLAAITSNMGAITAGTITGGTIQTSSSGSRAVMDSSGLRGYALDGVTKVFEINVGSGIASFTGIANIDPLSVIPGGTITAGTLPGDRIVAASVATAQLAAGAVTTNILAAGAVTAQKISVEWGGSNVYENSSFEDSVAMNKWAVYQGFPDTPTVVAVAESPAGVVPRDGTKVCRVERLGSGSSTYATGTYSAATYGSGGAGSNHAGIYQAVYGLPGQKYTMSIYAMIPATKPSGSLTVYAADGGATGGYWDTNTSHVVPNDGVWRRYSHTFTYAPWGSAANASPTGLLGTFFWLANAAPGSMVYLDSAQMEPGEIVTAYARRPGEVLTGEVGATKITPNSITSNEIMARSIVAGDLVIGTITADEIAGSSITANKLSVTTLSAITADMGAITAGTITGAVVRTSAATTRVQMDSTGVYALQSGVTTFRLNATSGIISQGKRAVASNELIFGSDGTTTLSTGTSVTITVDSDVSLVHIFVEAEIYSESDVTQVFIREATDFSGGLAVGAGGSNAYQYIRSVPGSAAGTSSRFAGYLSYRPTSGTRTYEIQAVSPVDAANFTDAKIRNRMIHVYTT